MPYIIWIHTQDPADKPFGATVSCFVRENGEALSNVCVLEGTCALLCIADSGTDAVADLGFHDARAATPGSPPPLPSTVTTCYQYVFYSTQFCQLQQQYACSLYPRAVVVAAGGWYCCWWTAQDAPRCCVSPKRLSQYFML